MITTTLNPETIALWDRATFDPITNEYFYYKEVVTSGLHLGVSSWLISQGFHEPELISLDGYHHY